MIDLKELIAKYPDCLENTSKLRSYLLDLYPKEKRDINIIVTIKECGIVDTIISRKGLINDIELNIWYKKLFNEFGYANTLSERIIQLWLSIYKEQENHQNFQNISNGKTEIKNDNTNIIKPIEVKKNINWWGRFVFGDYPQGADGELEPIEWDILCKNDDKALIISHYILDIGKFDSDNNNYKNSEIRQWLNDTFYNIAFKKPQQDCILVTDVKNDVENDVYEIVSENTLDKVFLLSLEEAIRFYKTEYGVYFSRRAQGTDYAKAKGLYISNCQYSEGNSDWWLRSPSFNDSAEVLYINGRGNDVYANVISRSIGIRPALWIKIL